MSESYLVSSNKILGVSTNISEFRWLFGSHLPIETEDNFSKCVVKIRFIIMNKNEEQEIITKHKIANNKYQHFRCGDNKDSITYVRSIFLSGVLILQLESLIGNYPVFKINNKYLKFVKYNFQNLQSFYTISSDIASIMLLKNNLCPIYCAAFKKDEITALVFGPPNIGKSICTLNICLEFLADYLSEDVAITDGISVYSVPRTASMRFNPEKNRDSQRIVFEKIPFLDLTAFGRIGYADDIIKKVKTCDSSKITHIVFLDSGDMEKIEYLDKHEAYKKINNLNRFLFRFDKSPLLNAYEYFNHELNIEDNRKNGLSIISDVLMNASKIINITSKNVFRYKDMLAEELKFGKL